MKYENVLPNDPLKESRKVIFYMLFNHFVIAGHVKSHFILSFHSDQKTHTIIQNTSKYSYHRTIYIVWYIYLHEWLIVYGKRLDGGVFLVNNTSPIMDAMGSSAGNLFSHGLPL